MRIRWAGKLFESSFFCYQFILEFISNSIKILKTSFLLLAKFTAHEKIKLALNLHKDTKIFFMAIFVVLFMY